MSKAIDILGLDLVLGKIDYIGREIENQAGELVQETVLEVAFDAKRDAPVDLGSLQQSINNGYDAGKLEGQVYVNAEHGPYVEFGTGIDVEIPDGWGEIAAQFKGKGIKRVSLPARPFLIPAAMNGYKNLQLKLLRLTQ